MSSDAQFIVSNEEIESFMVRCMITAGAKPDHAKALASCLTAADYRGHYSHGLNRLGNFVKV
jgi:LDH2 family malate/lactate/ureidoglycolate dehydrogenase